MPDQKHSDRIGNGVCNGILISWAVAAITVVVVGILSRVLDLSSGDGLTRTLALVGFVVFPVFTVAGRIVGGLKR